MSPIPLPFQDRTEVLERICGCTNRLLILYGEAGIGKSRLLQEAERRLCAQPGPVVVRLDLFEFPTIAPEGRVDALLGRIASSVNGRVITRGASNEQRAGEYVSWLNTQAGAAPVLLMLDTTETVQEDSAFWRWLEEHIISPLAVEELVSITLAGRNPAPLRNPEIRRRHALYRLEPLDPPDAVEILARDALARQTRLGTDNATVRLAPIVLDLSSGLPKLIEQLAIDMPESWDQMNAMQLTHHLCEQCVKPFIEKYLFDAEPDPWREILWWLSPLGQFDERLLLKYLGVVDPELATTQTEATIIEGVARLRRRKAVVWSDRQGYQLKGLIAPITRHCLEILDCDRCQRAREAWANILGETTA